MAAENELRLIRERLGWTQEKMAERLGVKRVTVVRNEHRQNPPRPIILAARYLHEHPEDQLEILKTEKR